MEESYSGEKGFSCEHSYLPYTLVRHHIIIDTSSITYKEIPRPWTFLWAIRGGNLTMGFPEPGAGEIIYSRVK